MLVVDDTPENLHLMHGLLKERYRVLLANGGVAALRLARDIKRDPALRGMPVIVLTRYSGPLDLLRGALSGCDTYLVKPVTLQTLRETVARCLRKSLSSISRNPGTMAHA